MNISERSIKRLREKCQDKGNGRYYSDWSEYIPRKVSIYFTKCFISVGISANQITLISVILGLLTAILIGFGEPLYVALAALMLFFITILDCSDGEVSRYHGRQSLSGEYLDRIAGAIIYPSILFAIGLSIFEYTGSMRDIVAGIIAGVSLLLMRISISYIYACSWNSLFNIESNSSKPLSYPKSSSKIYKNIEQVIDMPKTAKKNSVINFVSDLFLIKSWGMIFWVWCAAIVSFSSLFFGHYNYMKEILQPLIWLYAFFGPLAVCYIIYSVVRNNIPDRLAEELKNSQSEVSSEKGSENE
ncbi:MAG: CDP-alcohol phosphatidyltransferase family protein [Methanophagales archaeon]|nr:CDP-alcohol phosphatidyltransferase family protein [Methanophagales archaeon]